jgi:predicted hotdog family 3-hydroxylacyl-ACP dehydratase
VSDAELTRALQEFVGMPAEEFLLHREPMLLVGRLIDIGADFARCEWLADAPEFEEAGLGVPAYIGIETMAQCIAVHAGARARVRGFGPPLGFLLGTRHFTSSVSHYEPGRKYVAECTELVRDSQGMGSFSCQLQLDGERIAKANLAVLEQPQG